MDDPEPPLPASAGPDSPSGVRPFWGPWRTIPLLLVGLILVGYGAKGLVTAAQNRPAVRDERQSRIKTLNGELSPVKAAFANVVMGIYGPPSTKGATTAEAERRITEYLAGDGRSRLKPGGADKQRFDYLLGEVLRIATQIESLEAGMRSAEDAAHRIGSFVATLLAGLGILVFLWFVRRAHSSGPGASGAA